MIGLLLLNVLIVAIPASILGVLLVHRKAIMVADAISHSVLPGIVIAYILLPERNDLGLFIGAIICGMITTLLIDFFNKRLRLTFDVSIGVLFPVLFSIGILLMAKYAGVNSDIDMECVLFGDLETTVLETIEWNGKVYGTQFFYRLLPIMIFLISMILIGFRTWQSWLFNSEFLSIKGFKIEFMQLLLMLLLSVFSVVSFEGVGVVMVLGLLILPAATSLLFVRNLKQNFIYSTCIGIVSSIGGVLLGIYFDISIAPCVTLVNAVIFSLLLVFFVLKNNAKVVLPQK